MNFAPLSLAAVRDARPPAGALMPALQVDPSMLPAGWCQFDGSLASRAAYPDAAKIIGDVRFFNGAPVEQSTDLVMRAGVHSISSMKFLAFGSTVIAAGISFGTNGNTDTTAYRLWRSPDAGATWNAVDLPALANMAKEWRAEALEWFGGGRVLLVLTGISTANRYSLTVTFSNDSGQTWSAPKELAGVATGAVTLDSVSADAELVAGGAGYYYFGVQNSSASPASAALYALNPATNAVYSLGIGADGAPQRCRLIGGRSVAAGTSEVFYATWSNSAWWLTKATVTGAGISGAAGAGLALPTLGGIVGVRQFLTKGGDGSHYWLYNSTGIMRMPATWTGAPTLVHTGQDNIGWRLLTNALSNAVTGQRYDTATGLSSSIGGMNSGRARVGTLHGTTDRQWQEAVVVDKTPSADRHFVHAPTAAGTFVTRTTRAAENFVGAINESPDGARFLSYPTAGLCWFDPGTGQLKAFDFVAGTPSKIRVRTYAPANDYSNYIHLPYLPGLMARMR